MDMAAVMSLTGRWSPVMKHRTDRSHHRFLKPDVKREGRIWLWQTLTEHSLATNVFFGGGFPIHFSYHLYKSHIKDFVFFHWTPEYFDIQSK